VQHIFRASDNRSHIRSFLSSRFSVRRRDLYLYVNEQNINMVITSADQPSSAVMFDLKDRDLLYRIVTFCLRGATYSLLFPEVSMPFGRGESRDGAFFGVVVVIQMMPEFMRGEITDCQIYSGSTRLAYSLRIRNIPASGSSARKL
jgi:hypothetical protein